MQPVKLIMVTANNNNKFYNMTPNGDSFTAEYGRVNATAQTKVYPISKWHTLYRQKLAKGYKDVTKLYIENNTPTLVSNNPLHEVIIRLQSYTKNMVNANYSISSNAVTPAMIAEAQKIINAMSAMQVSTTAFNSYLIKLFNTLPRKMKKVQEYLATSSSQFGNIIAREQDMLDGIASVMPTNQTQVGGDILAQLGLQMSEKDTALESKVKDMLGEISHKYVNCWYISNDATQKRYEDNLAKQKGVHRTEQIFWHGSRNENWLSILKNGMLIRPSGAVYTGSMFDKDGGIYFANQAKKSFGYTSANGSYWANGNSNTAFMALFRVNTGKHHNVYKHTSECYQFTKQYLKDKGNYDSVYAHKGSSLRNDEFIIYDVSQCTIYALVELHA